MSHQLDGRAGQVGPARYMLDLTQNPRSCGAMGRQCPTLRRSSSFWSTRHGRLLTPAEIFLAQGIFVQLNLREQRGCMWMCPVASAMSDLHLSAATKIAASRSRRFILMAAPAAAQPVTVEISRGPLRLLVDADADADADPDAGPNYGAVVGCRHTCSRQAGQPLQWARPAFA